MDPLADLNEPQRQAVTHIEGPLLVLAGAGSGKTRVITRRIAYLVQQGVAPWNVLALTFTNKAAGEMKQRVEAMGVSRGATVCTFHSLCARLLREFSIESGLGGNFSIYDRDDQVKLVKEAMADLEIPSDRIPPGAVHAAISHAKNRLQTAEMFAEHAQEFFDRKVAQIFIEYQRRLSASNAVDFDDLLMKMASLLGHRNDIRQALSARFRFILIDEYQDTNRAQYIIAHAIAMEHENICATGDPDQSIYAWRGADITNIMEFETDYPRAKVVRLEENYRSTQPILTAASRLIAHNKMRKDKTLWTRREDGANVRVLTCPDQYSEAREVASRISAAKRAGRDYGDIAVFYRVNSLSRVMEEALLRSAIPYRIARGVEFYNRKEIKDLLAYLKLMVNPADDVSFARAVNTPARGIGQTTLKRLADYAASQNTPMMRACEEVLHSPLPAAAAKKLAGFADLIRGLSAATHAGVKNTMEAVLDRSGLGASLGGKDEEDRQALANVNELISSAQEFDASAEEPTLEAYLHQVGLVSDVDHFEGAGGAVSLMTLHAAKGLEFPVVFVVGCEQGLLPFERADESLEPKAVQNRLEEERRLAFVGMTRAMDELTLSHSRSRMIRGQTMPMAPSLYLEEIGKENITFESPFESQTPAIRPMRRASGGFYEDVVQRAAIEEMQEHPEAAFPPEYEDLQVGSRVRHPSFGDGQVTRVSQQWPNTRVDVFFERGGPKTLVLALSKLRVL